MNFNQLCKKYNLVFQENENQLVIKKKLTFFTKSTIGILLILLMAIALLYICIIEPEKGLILYFGIMLSLFIIVFSILSLLKNATDRVMITPKDFIVKNSLRKRKIDLNSKLRLRLRSTQETERLKNQTSYHRVIELFLVADGEEIRILDLIAPESDREEIEYLGNELLLLINQSLKV